jgi:hypothetical protein
MRQDSKKHQQARMNDDGCEGLGRGHANNLRSEVRSVYCLLRRSLQVHNLVHIAGLGTHELQKSKRRFYTIIVLVRRF